MEINSSIKSMMSAIAQTQAELPIAEHGLKEVNTCAKQLGENFEEINRLCNKFKVK